jgi:hypothetical protein
MVTMLFYFAKGHESRASRIAGIGSNFPNLLTLCDPSFVQVRMMDAPNLIESEERYTDASRLQPRVAERGTSILSMARPTGAHPPVA